MRISKYLAVLVIMTLACNDGYIDDINAVEPGPDQDPPTISITSLTDTVAMPFTQVESDLEITFSVSDDIELGNVTVSFNGTNVGSYDAFIDYRNLRETIIIESVAVGNYSVEITATDLTGKQVSETVDFLLTNQYFPLEGEIFYMPFEGEEFEDIISETFASPSGDPGFVDGVFGEAVEFNAENRSYLIFPANEEIAGLESFTLSFWTFADFIDADENGQIDGILGLVNLSNSNLFWGNIDVFVENNSNPVDGADMRLHVTNDDSETWIANVNDQPNIFNRWSHHVLSYDNEARLFRYYINGEVMTTIAANWTDNLAFQDAENLIIGCVQFQTDPSSTSATGSQPWASYLTGEIDEIKIFDRAISANEVLALFNANNPN